MIRHTSPTPGSVGVPSAPRQRLERRTLVFDGVVLHRLFRSTAYAIALARYTKASPMKSDAKDSFGVKAIIAMTPDRFLTQEVDVPDSALLEKETAAGAEAFGALFWNELDERGVAGAKKFLEDVEAQRENALAKVKQVYRDASAHNQGAMQTQESIYHSLVTVRCASTIIVAGLALPVVISGAAAVGIGAAGVSGLAGFGVGTTYSIALNLIDNWDHASSADLVLVSTKEAAKDTGIQKATDGADAMSKIYGSESQDLATAERKIEWLTKRIAAAETPEEKAKLLRRLARTEDAAQVARNAGRLSTALKAVPYLFFAWSTYDALKTAHEQW